MKLLLYIFSLFAGLVNCLPVGKELLAQAALSEAMEDVEKIISAVKGITHNGLSDFQHATGTSEKPAVVNQVAHVMAAKKPAVVNQVAHEEIAAETEKKALSEAMEDVAQNEKAPRVFLKDAREKASGFASATKEKASGFASATKEKATRFASLTKEKLIQFKEYVASLFAKISQAASKTKDSVVNTASRVKTAAGSAGTKAKDSVKTTAEKTLADSKAVLERFRKTLQRFRQDILRKTKNPEENLLK